jgi:hypothetical protein
MRPYKRELDKVGYPVGRKGRAAPFVVADAARRFGLAFRYSIVKWIVMATTLFSFVLPVAKNPSKHGLITIEPAVLAGEV